MSQANSRIRRRAGAAAALLISCCTLVATAALPVGAADAAEPAAWNRTDPIGDAPPPADITTAATHWGPKGTTIFVRVDVLDLEQTGRFRVSLVDDGETIHIFVKKNLTTTLPRIQSFDVEGNHQNLPCKGISVEWNAIADYVFVSAPLGSCVDSGPWGTDGVLLKGPLGAVDKVGRIFWTGD
jgi:hypothetical protein